MMDARTETLRQALAARDIDRLLDMVPFAKFLGLVPEWDGDDLLLLMPMRERLIGNPMLPALHGGAVGALLESAAIFKLMCEVDPPQVPKIINITVDYLRSGRPKHTRARTMITKQGRRVANVQVRAFQDDESSPIAVAHAHFLLRSS